MDAGYCTWVLWKSASALNCTGISPALLGSADISTHCPSVEGGLLFLQSVMLNREREALLQDEVTLILRTSLRVDGSQEGNFGK